MLSILLFAFPQKKKKQGATATTGDAFVPLASRKIYGKLLQNETGLK